MSILKGTKKNPQTGTTARPGAEEGRGGAGAPGGARGADGSAPPALLPLPELGKLPALGTSWEDPRVAD